MIRAANEWRKPGFMHITSNYTILHRLFGNQTVDFSNEPLDLDRGPRGAQRCSAR